MEFFLPRGEKRAFPRTRISLNCELQAKDSDSRLLGQCLDLSTTGARVILSETLACGSRAHFKLREHLGKEPFEAIVEITRIDIISDHLETEVSQEDGNTVDQADNKGGEGKEENTPKRYCAGLKIIEIL